ncbi:hypothetical protein ACOZDE_18945 [Streptomyces griseoincarnatus]
MGIRDAARNFGRSLKPGDDRALAESQYAGRESASDAAARKRRERHRKSVLKHGDKQPGRVPRSWTRGG